MQRLYDMFISIAWIVAVFLLLYSVVLIVFQRNMIYFPRTYDARYHDVLPMRVDIPYKTQAGQQIAYYIPPKHKQKPDSIWMLLGGNAALALDWADLVMQYPDNSAGFLLIDYPGYGRNKGKPSKHANIAAVNAAYNALLTYLKISQSEPMLPFKLNVLGHSLGASVAVEFTLHHPVQRLLLLSPFTSMQAMVRKHIAFGLGFVLQGLLFDRYNLKEGLSKIEENQIKPEVVIIHGAQDEIVPVTMSRELANRYQDWVVYKELPAENHNFVYSQLVFIIDAMTANIGH